MGDIKKVGKVAGTIAGFAAGGPLGAAVGGAAGGGGSVPKAVKKVGRGLVGHTEQIDTVPGDVKDLRAQFINALMQGLPGNVNAAFGFGQGSQGFSALDPSIVKPYSDLFTAQRGEALGQAKESAGNLTGSGYNNLLGTSLAGSLASEQTTLANLGIQQQQFQQQRQQDFLRTLLGLTTQQAQVGYKPGFLDYLFKGAQAAGPAIAAAVGGGGGAGGAAPSFSGQPVPNPYISDIPIVAPWATPPHYIPFNYGG
jgi:hypothetical protein